MGLRYQQGHVSKIIWPWQDAKKSKVWAGPTLTYSFVTLAVGLAVSCAFWYFGHVSMSFLVAGISGFIFISARFFPEVYKVIEQVLAKFSHIVGQILTWLLLVPFFYLFFTLGRCFQKVSGRDPMARKLDPDVHTYWCSREMNFDPDQYRRQF